MRGKSVEDIIVRDTNIVQSIEEELKDELQVFEDYAEVMGVEPNFRIKNGETIRQYMQRQQFCSQSEQNSSHNYCHNHGSDSDECDDDQDS